MHSSKFSAWCDRLLEVGWLLAVIVTPLFFNVYSSRVFEPDKLTTLRTLAVMMAAVWLARFVEEAARGRISLEVGWHTPFVRPALFTVIVYLVSTVFSITPYVSLFGSYQRLQGTFTTLSYIVLFLIVLDRMHTRAQLERLVSVIILTSLPVSLYGLVQRNGLDPLPWGGDVTRRVAANMGNSIFVAAYLMMVLPLTAGRVIECLRDILAQERANWTEVLRAAGYIFILIVEGVAFWFAQSRGPLLGLIAGGYVFLVLFTMAWRSRWSAAGTLAVMGVTAAVIVFLVVVNIPGGPLRSLQHAPWLGRLGSVFDFERGTGKVRALIWEGMIDLILPHEPLEQPPTQVHPEGYADPYNALRPLVGYGPESIYVAYNRFYPPLLGHYESRTASPDRSHNETLDALAITGVLGLAAYLWMFGSLFASGLKWLGLLRERWQRSLLAGLVVGLSSASVAFFWWWQGLHFFGAALTLGIVSGLGLYLAFLALRHARGVLRAEPLSSLLNHPYHLLMLSIIAACVAHFVEINFGIAIASTRTMFWVYAGVLALVGTRLTRENESVGLGPIEPVTLGPAVRRPGEQACTKKGRVRESHQRHTAPRGQSPRTPVVFTRWPPWLGSTLALGLIGGFILGTLAFCFVTNAQRLARPSAIVWQSLTSMAVQGGRRSFGALMIVLVTWVISALTFVPELVRRGRAVQSPERRCRTAGNGAGTAIVYLLTSLAVGLLFALALAARQASVVRVQPTTVQELLAIADRIAGLITMYYGLILFVLVGASLALLLEQPGLPVPIVHHWGLLAGVGLSILAVVLIVSYNLRPIQADIVFKQGEPYEREGQWQLAALHYNRAIELAPQEDFYYLYLGRALLEYASAAQDPLVRDALMRQTERALLQARELNPLNTDHSANLARMYRRWADLSADPATRQKLLEQSSYNYGLATSLSPHNAILWNEWSILYYYGLRDMAGYERTHQRSLELDPEFDQTWLICGDVARDRERYDEAIECYEEALRLNPRNADAWAALGTVYRLAGQPQRAIEAYRQSVERNARQPQVWRVLADLYITQQRWTDAIEALQQVVVLEPEAEDIWNIHQVLAQLYTQVDEPQIALEEARRALTLAPTDQQPALEALIVQIEQLVQPED